MTLQCHGKCKREKFSGFFSAAERFRKTPICMACRNTNSKASRAKFRPKTQQVNWKQYGETLFLPNSRPPRPA